MTRRVVTPLCGAIAGVSVVVLAYRCSIADLGDGQIDVTSVVFMGVLLFVAPVTLTASLVDDGRLWLSRSLAILCGVASGFIAAARPGNLVGVVFPIVAVPCVVAMSLAGSVQRRAKRRSRW